jgi:hypothetical protein
LNLCKEFQLNCFVFAQSFPHLTPSTLLKDFRYFVFFKSSISTFCFVLDTDLLFVVSVSHDLLGGELKRCEL